MRAGKSEDNFAFMRYSYMATSPVEVWDREIKMFKDPYVEYEESQETFDSRSTDQFRGLLVKYLRKADLDKRKEICEY